MVSSSHIKRTRGSSEFHPEANQTTQMILSSKTTSRFSRRSTIRGTSPLLPSLLIAAGTTANALAGTLTVESGQTAGNPDVLAYNIGHMVEGSNVLDWWRYSGVNGARMFLNPKEIEPNDDIPGTGDGVSDQASFLSRRSALRADPLNPSYIDWADFEFQYANNDMGTPTNGNIFKPDYALGKLHEMGITVLAQISTPESHLPIANDNDWAGKWELWQHFYAQAFYLSRHYDVHRFQMYNEPNHPNANGLTAENWLMRLQLASDAAQCAIADVNALYGKSLETLIYGPVNSGGSDVYSGSGWGDYAVANRHVNFLGETDPNYWVMHRYDYHEYNSQPSEFGSNLSSLRSAMSADMSPETRFPITISEFNVHTNGEFDTKTKTLDEASRYARFGSISVQLAKNFMKEFYCFKFAQTGSGSGDNYPVKKNGMHYVQTHDAPHNYGGATKSAEVWRMFNKAMRPGGAQLGYTRDTDLTVLDQRATYDPATDSYYVFSSNYTTGDVNLAIDTSAWNIAVGSPFKVEEVSAAHSGGIRKWSTVSADGTLFNETDNVFVQESYTVLLFTIPAGSMGAEQLIPASDDATVIDGGNTGNNYGSSTTLEVRNDPANASNRKAAYLKFDVPVGYAPDIQMAVLTLPASTSASGENIQAHVYGLDDSSWSENSVTWSTGPNLLQGVPAGNLIEHRVIDDQGTTAFIQGQLVVSDTSVTDKSIDVTEFVRSKVGGGASFLISQDPRWDVTLPDLETGDTQADGIEISSSESGNGPVLRIVRRFDSDGDGLSDHAETNVFLTDPGLADTDSDGLSDGEEVLNGSDPNDANSPTPALPVAHWTFDEGAGAIAADSSGNGHDGSITDGNWVAGADGGALDFNGSTSRVSIPASSFNTVSNEITVAMWINGDVTQPRDDSSFYAVDSSGNRVINVHLPWSNSTVYWDAGFSGGYDRINKTANSNEFMGDWNHWVFTKDAGTGVMSIYLNGALWHSGTGKTRTISGITSAVIGGQITSYSYDGAIDDVQLYDVALSENQVASLFSGYSQTQPPAFAADPIIEVNGEVGLPYSSTLADDASDAESDPLSFSKVSGPSWLTIAANGDLSGTPGSADVGLNSFTVQVDAVDGSDTASLEITVDAAPNLPPSFASDPVVEANGEEEMAYSSTIADNASDPESDPMNFSKLSGPSWLAVAADGSLSGTPTTADVGLNSFSVQVDATGGSDVATLEITVDASSYLGDFALSEVMTLGAVTGGSIQETYVVDDDVYQVLTEEQSGGNPANRRSQLEHTWTFDVLGGELVTFYVEAHHDVNSEGDDFTFAYSTDNANFTDMVTVTKTADDDIQQSFALPGSLSGQVFVRVADTDRTRGNSATDSLYVDGLFIISEAASGPPTQASNPSPADGATGVSLSPALTWAAGDQASSHDLYFGTNPTPGGSEFQGNQSATSFSPGNLAASTTYYWAVDEVNGAGTTPGPVWSFTTGAGSPEVHVNSIVLGTQRAGKNYRGNATIQIVDSSTGQPVQGAIVSGNFTGAFSESGSGTTDASGEVVITTGAKIPLPFSFTFTVTGVTLGGYDYNPANNVETSDTGSF